MLRSLAFSLLLTVPLAAQSLDDRVQRELPKLLETYKTLHATPELSTQEVKTSAFVAAQLRELGYEVTERVGKYKEPGTTAYGVVAILRNGAGPVVLVRSDMDGLPVAEQTSLPYASQNAGVMHACGHDVHMTTLIGTAKLLVDLKSQWRGTVMLIGQPAEEIVRGAEGMLADGLYERFAKPDFAVALHDWSGLEAGKIGYRPGQFMAATDSINVTIRGVGGHGAAPHSTKDPVVMAAETILALQTISSRETSPLDPVVVTVGKIEGGTKRNIIPDEVRLFLTVRTMSPAVRKRVLESIERIPRGIALVAGVPEDRAPIFEPLPGESVGATFNDPALTERVKNAIARELGAANVVLIDPAMVSEDFGRFGVDGIPTALLALGAADPAKLADGTQPGLHSSKFAPTDPSLVLRTGVRGAVSMVLDLLAKK
ncbi:MAG TPA: amidohydrolase [Thermoanaerobaculia bacterium]|jgi:hippurate hydrolase|nr:amidohydrolase [Thermoanaerobaculia bacterium]